jgi:AP endonuclease-2
VCTLALNDIVHLAGWNTRISARESNYGARVDYVLVTRGLLPWIKHGDIQPSLKGSDHCPIYIDLHDEITLESGTTLTLRQAMGQDGEPKEPPRIAAKFWDEFSGKQTSLKAFFGKHGNISPAPSDGLPPSDEPVGADDAPSEPLPQSTTSAGTTENQLTKRKIATNGSTREVKTKKLKTGQTKLSTFFSRAQSLSSPLAQQMDEDQLEADYRLAVQLSSEDGALPSVQRLLQHSDSSPHESKGKGKAWGQLLAPLQPPKCTIHGEPAKELTVTKNGPNKGKNFFICSRCVFASQCGRIILTEQWYQGPLALGMTREERRGLGRRLTIGSSVITSSGRVRSRGRL